MTKEEKVLVIQELKELLQDAKVVYVANLEGMNAAATSDFRRQAFKSNVTLRVVKKYIASKKRWNKQREQITQKCSLHSKETLSLMIAEVANAPAKLIKNFRKNGAFPALKSAYLQETFLYW